MAYTTPAAVRAVLSPDGDPTDPSTAAGLDDNALLGACQQASDEVDARLGTRYQTPITTAVPSVVGDLATDIAAYLVTLTFRKGQPMAATDPVYLRYQRALAFLKDITTGAATLPLSSVSAVAGEVVVANPIGAPLFGPDDYALYPTPGTGRLSADRYGYDGWSG